MGWCWGHNTSERAKQKPFEADGDGAAYHQALEAIHGRLGGGRLLTGVEVFAEAYRRADLRMLAGLLSVRWLGPLWRLGYRLFARYCHAISCAAGPALLRIASRRFHRPKVRRAIPACSAGRGADGLGKFAEMIAVDGDPLDARPRHPFELGQTMWSTHDDRDTVAALGARRHEPPAFRVKG